MYCLGNAERLRLDNLLSFMLHELVFLGCHSHFASYPQSFASYSYSCKIPQPYVAATVRMRSDAVLFSTGAPLMKTVTKNNCQQLMVVLHKPLSLQIRSPATCKSALKPVHVTTMYSPFTELTDKFLSTTQ